MFNETDTKGLTKKKTSHKMIFHLDSFIPSEPYEEFKTRRISYIVYVNNSFWV